jgi:hypothetical protein
VVSVFYSPIDGCLFLHGTKLSVVPEADMKTEGLLWVFAGLVFLSLVVRYVIGLKDVLGRTLPRRHSPEMSQLRGAGKDQRAQGFRVSPSDSEDHVCQCFCGKQG